MRPICYFIGHWEGKDFHYVAEVNTWGLAKKVAEITGREILSDNDADSVENFIRDYGNQERSDAAATEENATLPRCPSGDLYCAYWTEYGCTLKDPAHKCYDYMHCNDDDDENA